jgi:hypothetical protein
MLGKSASHGAGSRLSRNLADNRPIQLALAGHAPNDEAALQVDDRQKING